MYGPSGSSEYIKLLGYRRFHYRLWPGPATHRLLLLHGRGESADTWGLFASQMRAAAESRALDLRGHGGTPWDPDGNYALSDFLDDLLLKLGHWARPSVLVGHGLGGRLAVAAALARPELVAGIVLIETDPKREPDRTLLARLLDAHTAGERYMSAGVFGSPEWRAMFRELSWAQPGGGRRFKCDPATLARREETPIWADAAAVTQPALVIRGRDGDGVPEEAAKRLAETFPQGHYAEVPGSAWPQVDAAEETMTAVRDFLSVLPSPVTRS